MRFRCLIGQGLGADHAYVGIRAVPSPAPSRTGKTRYGWAHMQNENEERGERREERREKREERKELLVAYPILQSIHPLAMGEWGMLELRRCASAVGP